MCDFDALSPQEQLLLVQAEYGKTMLRAHGLERSLATLLICHVTFAGDHKASLDFEINKIKRLPLGLLINKFLETFSASEDLIEELDNLLFFRNDLAHRISDTIIYAAMSVDWEKKVIAELVDIRSYFTDAEPLLQPYMEVFNQKLGVSDAKMQEIMNKLYPGIAGSTVSGAAQETPDN